MPDLAWIAQFGIAGIFCFMWWQERSDRIRANGHATTADQYTALLKNELTELVNVIDRNTEAVTKIREHCQSVCQQGGP